MDNNNFFKNDLGYKGDWTNEANKPEIDLKFLNNNKARLDDKNYDFEKWNAHKNKMQNYTDSIRDEYKNKQIQNSLDNLENSNSLVSGKWFKENRPEEYKEKINDIKTGKYATDLLELGLNHDRQPRDILKTRDYMADELTKKLGEGYDKEDVVEYVNQYFNLSPEKIKELENFVKEEDEDNFDPELEEEKYMRRNYSPDYDFDKEGW